MSGRDTAAAARVLDRLDALAALTGPGIDRPGFSTAEDAAHALVGGWMRDAGLSVGVGPAGTLVGRRPARDGDPRAPAVASGSHLDTVADGGRFDGALGVLCALEAVAATTPDAVPLEVLAFRDEEGVRFGAGCTGSRAFVGRLPEGDLDLVDAAGTTLREALAPYPPPRAADDGPAPLAFVEVHAEQGPRLSRRDEPVARVDAVAGQVRLRVVLEGRAGHAGAHPMPGRRDALVAAARIVLAVRDATVAEHPGATATVGRLVALPGQVNVVPGRADLTVDLRAPDAATLDALRARVVGIVGAAGAAESVTADVHPLGAEAPVAFSGEVDTALRASAAGARAPVLASGAGHDAAVLMASGIPSGMLFVRSGADGAAHDPAEWCDPADVAVAIGVLRAALARLAGADSTQRDAATRP